MSIISKTLGKLLDYVTGRSSDDQAPAVVELEHTVEEIEAAAEQYAEGAELARRGEALKRQARKVLGALPEGTYGRATVSRKANSPITDKTAMEKLLRGQGVALPMMERAGSLVVDITAAADIAPAGSSDWVSGIFDNYRPAALAA